MSTVKNAREKMGLFDFLKKKSATPTPRIISPADRGKYEQVLADIFGGMNFQAVEEASRKQTKTIKTILHKTGISLNEFEVGMLKDFPNGLITWEGYPQKPYLNQRTTTKLLQAIEQGTFSPPTMDLEVLVPNDKVPLAKKILGTVFTATPDTSSLRNIDLTHDGTTPPPPSTSTRLTYAVTQQEADNLRGIIAGRGETHLAPNDPDLAPFLQVTLSSRCEAEASMHGEYCYNWQRPTADIQKTLGLSTPKKAATRQLPPGGDTSQRGR
jgi:hypothetical protein